MVDEAPLTLPWKLGCAFFALLFTSVAGYIVWFMMALDHDKSIDSEVGTLWLHPTNIPLGEVQTTDNRWMSKSFIADTSRVEGKALAILVLDDHYWIQEPYSHTESGVIGDQIRREVLCTVPWQVKAKKVTLDPAVGKLIAAQCH